jgi:AcrR family transcriptional regulator
MPRRPGAAEASEQRSRRPGRPRDARADEAILEAALELFVRDGFGPMSIERVAERAGVGKTTVYRRFSSKEDLVVASIARLTSQVEAPDTDSVRSDLVALLTRFQEILVTSGVGKVFPRMATEIANGTPLGRVYQKQIIAPRFALVEQILRRGMARGELPERTDLEPVRDLILGAVMIARLTNRLSAKTAQARAEALAGTILDGLRAR